MQVLDDGQDQHETNGGPINNLCEGFEEIDIYSLSITSFTESCLESFTMPSE